MRGTLALTVLLTVTCGSLCTEVGESLESVLQHVAAVHRQQRARFDASVRQLTIDVGGQIYRTPITDRRVAKVSQKCDRLTRQHWSGIREYLTTKKDYILIELPAAARRLVDQRPLAVQQNQLVQHYLGQFEREAKYFVDSTLGNLDVLEARALNLLQMAYVDVLRLSAAAVAANRSGATFQEVYVALFETTRNLCRQHEQLFWDVKSAQLNHLVKRSQQMADVISSIEV